MPQSLLSLSRQTTVRGPMGVISKTRIAGLAFLTLTGLYVGVWATFFPRSFYANQQDQKELS